jgi:hypothetical protein
MPTHTTLTCAHPRQLLPEISSRIIEREFGGSRIRIDGPGKSGTHPAADLGSTRTGENATNSIATNDCFVFVE